ncbi:hypothetical protein [Bradyrhizobium sp.]|uniref:hypothetical protein n=1 Tax=Bradyrhizobium sp. TaxID=376 RepID=UPI0025B8AFA0|nr:hypothetical protein [Bradyrhizobium sp.]
MRKLLIGALGLSLTGCSHSPPLPTLATSCRDGDRLTFDGRSAANSPLNFLSFRTKSASLHGKPLHAAKGAKRPPDHAGKDRAAKTAPRVAAARGESAPTRPLAPAPPEAPAPTPEPVTTATTRAVSAPAEGVASPSAPPRDVPRLARSIQQEVADATADVERSNPPATAGEADGLVAVLMTRLNITDVSDLTAKSVAIDGRFAASAAMIRTAIVAAGASEVQLSEATTTAIDRLASGEVPAAIVALAAPEAADAFPDVTGFRTFRVPLSPRSLKPRR